MINREVEIERCRFAFFLRDSCSSIAKLTRLTFRFARYKIYTSFLDSGRVVRNSQKIVFSFDRNTIRNSNFLKNFPLYWNFGKVIRNLTRLFPRSIGIQYEILIFLKILFSKLSKSCSKFSRHRYSPSLVQYEISHKILILRIFSSS